MAPGISTGASVGPTVAAALTPGVVYRLLDMTSWHTTDQTFRRVRETGVSLAPFDSQTEGPLDGGPPLLSSVDPPIGARLKEVAVWYRAPQGEPALLALLRKPVDGPVPVDAMQQPVALASISPLPTTDPASTALVQATLTVDEAVDGTATYPLLFFPSHTTQEVAAIRFGYVATAQAFVAEPAIRRVLDTRLSGGKLHAGEERVVNLGVPPNARSAVINVTITNTEQEGFVAVFPANTVWPGNSSINWFATGQSLANAVICAVDSSGAIRMHGGVNATDVIIDVQGYMV